MRYEIEFHEPVRLDGYPVEIILLLDTDATECEEGSKIVIELPTKEVHAAIRFRQTLPSGRRVIRYLDLKPIAK